MNKDNKTYLEANPQKQREKAAEALKKAKELEKQQLANGKKYHKVGKTMILK